MSNVTTTPAHLLHEQIASAVQNVKDRIDIFGFAVWPFTPDNEHGIPPGFSTIGFTKLNMPEFYVSGIPAHSKQADEIIVGLREMYAYARDTATSISAQDLCNQINSTPTPEGRIGVYQWRPVDPVRMMYGQCTTLRYWAEDVGLTSLVSGIQIVHRPSAEADFPMVSTPMQLLLDWIPYGTKPYFAADPKLAEVA